MKYLYDGFNWLVRFDKGEQLVSGIESFIKEQGIDSGWVTAIGAAQGVELGFYDLEAHKYHWRQVDKLQEIVSLNGNIAWADETLTLHLHGSLANKAGEVTGGHIRELTVAGTCEVFIHKWYAGKLTRTLDPKVGLKTLDV